MTVNFKESRVDTLIPHLKTYYENDKNLLLIGLHGVGKTEAIKTFAAENDIRVCYLSCSTIDPFCDFVGIPTPRRACSHCLEHNPSMGYWPVDNFFCPFCESEGRKTLLGEEILKNVRPDQIENAELLFLDELNRSQDATRNAMMELIQYKSINGHRLPHLKAVWAAINPPDVGKYTVEDLDLATIDRFDAFVQVDPHPSIAYMTKVANVDKLDALSILAWYNDMDQDVRSLENWPSPRRLVKIGQMQVLTGNPTIAIPPWWEIDREKLTQKLEAADAHRKQLAGITGGKLGDGATSRFIYDKDWLKTNHDDVVKYLKDNVMDLDTSRSIVQAISSCQSKTLVGDYVEMLEELAPKVLESFVASLTETKFESFVTLFDEQKESVFTDSSFPNLTRELDERGA